MTAPELGDWEAVWMGLEDTEAEDGWFPTEWDVTFNELSIFEKKVTFGRIDKDSDDIVSSYIMSDWSGGGQIDLLTGADQSRYRHGVLDARTPGAITLPQYVEEITPTGATGDTTYPMYQIGNYPVHIKDDRIYTWDEDTDTLSTGVAIAHDPVGKPTRFNTGLHVPLGTSGYAIVTLSGTDPVWNRYAGVSEGADKDAVSSPNAVDFEVWDNKIWALTPTGVLAYSFTGANGAWFWDQAWDEARAAFLKLDTSQTPKRLLTYVDNNGDPVLVIITDQAAFRVDFVSKEYAKTAIQFPPHPDFGRGATVWRPGEDLKIAVGLEMISYSAAGVVDPETGLSRNDGMPFTNLGTITDLEAETSSLYAAVTGSSSSSVSYDYSDTVGSAGTGNGQFADVRGLVCDSTGDVQVCDENNERVQRFDSALTYEGQHGSAGTGDDNYASDDGPYDIAVDGSDNLWVLDRGNSRVKKLSRLGVFDSEFGSAGMGGTPVWTLQSTVSTLNSVAIDGPRGIGRDSSDNLYLCDYANSRLVKTNSAGTYTSTGQINAGAGKPKWACVDSSGNIYATYDEGASIDNVVKLNSSFVEQAESSAYSGADTRGICTDDTYIYVAVGHSVQRRAASDVDTESGTWGNNGAGVVRFGNVSTAGSTTARLNTPYGVCISGLHLYVVDAGNNRVMKLLLSDGSYVAQFAINAGGRGIDVLSTGDLAVSETTGSDITVYTTTGTVVNTFTQVSPYGLAVITGDKLWIANNSGDSLAQWDEAAGSSAASGEFSNPSSIDIKRSSGRIYVADSGNLRIQYFTSAGAYEGEWGEAGSGDGQFGASGPTAIAVNQTTGDVYVVDPSNYRVQQFSATGTFTREWGQSGTDDGEFQSPTCLDIHPTTLSVFVGDAGRDDVQEFTSSGTFLRRFGSSGSDAGEFTSISGLCINQAGTLIYVADDSLERVQAFDATTASAVFLALPSIHYWTGSGWHGAWEHTDSSEQLTWMSLTATSHTIDGYRLWWGCTDGKLYTMPLRRTFHNPRSGWQAGYDRFAASGYLISSRFDALMAGFDKKASRLVVFMDNATSTERVRVQYRIDSEDMPWTDFTDSSGDAIYITTIGRTVLPFGVDTDGFSWGEQFNWIQFKFLMERGDNPYQTPVMSAAVLNYTKVPQQARTFMFTVPFPKESWNGRTGIQIRDGLADLLRASQYVKLVHGDTTYRGQLAAIAGITSLGANTNGGATVNFIEIGVDN
jgi:tripartite motif-containing protein 71